MGGGVCQLVVCGKKKYIHKLESYLITGGRMQVETAIVKRYTRTPITTNYNSCQFKWDTVYVICLCEVVSHNYILYSYNVI